MRKNSFLGTCLAGSIAAAAWSGCGPDRFEDDIRVWIEDSPWLNSELVMDGCRAWTWTDTAAECTEVGDRDQANTVVLADDRDCVADAFSGKVILGKARRRTGEITFYTHCIGTRGRLDIAACASRLRDSEICRTFQSVAAHEFGHRRGVWAHVPSCDGLEEGKVPSHQAGVPICGPALMNPASAGRIYPNEIDILAYDYVTRGGNLPSDDSDLATRGLEEVEECHLHRDAMSAGQP